MKIIEALKTAQEQLAQQKIKTAWLDAEIILAFCLNKSKEFLYLNPQQELTTKQLTGFQKLVNQRAKAKPVAYLIKTKEFYGLDFFVDQRVLIPRPETELMIEEILSQTKNEKMTLADIGTGSGCIAITLAKHRPKAKILATDISAKALTVAKKNAKRHKVKPQFFLGNLITPLKNRKIDVLVANLPYGWAEWKNNKRIEGQSLKFEPPKALFTRENGLYLYRQFFKQINNRPQKPKLILLEFDPRQKNNLIKLVNKYLPLYQVKIKKDLARLNRLLILKLIKH